jgi:hypothetical protein
MAKKKHRAFFIYPRWNEVVPSEMTVPIRVHEKTLAAINPLAQSTVSSVTSRSTHGHSFKKLPG